MSMYGESFEKVREFETGATRDSDDNKFDIEGFINPTVLRRYCQYLHEHRIQSDGKKRDSDNWQKGIPKDVYMKSLLRHVLDMWEKHRFSASEQLNMSDVDNKKFHDSICAVIFNAFGYLFEESKEINFQY